MRRPVVVPRRGEFLWARLRLRRRELVWWLTAIGLAVVSVAAVSGGLGRADAAGHRWGPTRAVLVATRPIEVGHHVVAADIELDEWPAGLVPPDAVVGAGEGRVAVAAIGAGEVLVERRLAPNGLRGAAALLPPATRALAIPTLAGGLALEPGDLVDILSITDPYSLDLAPNAPASGPATETVSHATSVVAVSDDSITVAVPTADVGDVAAALSHGVVTLALASPIDALGPVETGP